MRGGSWTHILARWAILPLLGTGVTPNHLTLLRVLSGVAACVAFAVGSTAWTNWGGGLWLLSAFLDRADGELARVGKMMSRQGHLFDFYSDVAVNTLFFVAIGIGQRHSSLGSWSITLGLFAGVGLCLCGLWSNWLERRSPPDTRAVAGRWGFDPDDALYLLAPFAWLGWLPGVLVGATLVTPPVAANIGFRLLAVRRAQAALLRTSG